MPTRTNQPGDENLLDLFATVNIWRRGEERAPHKPLLLLYALAALQRGEDRLIPFASIEEDVGRLLRYFGPATYVTQQGERPMSITWRLHHPMPVAFFEEMKVLAAKSMQYLSNTNQY